MADIFISDLHLDPAHEDVCAFFFEFIDDLTTQSCAALYLLGDIFEVWVGDDEQAPLHQAVAGALGRLAVGGTRIFLMQGNRDFLLGEAYARACHAELLTDPSIITPGGIRTLLLHGDSLCTRDERYQKFRALTRDHNWQQTVLNRPLADRQLMARQLRQMSEATNQDKSASIMDVTEEDVAAMMANQQCPRMIHGHTHRPAHHRYHDGNNSIRERLVLGDWGDSMVYARAEDTRVDLFRRDRKGREERLSPVDRYESEVQHPVG